MRKMVSGQRATSIKSHGKVKVNGPFDVGWPDTLQTYGDKRPSSVKRIRQVREIWRQTNARWRPGKRPGDSNDKVARRASRNRSGDLAPGASLPERKQVARRLRSAA